MALEVVSNVVSTSSAGSRMHPFFRPSVEKVSSSQHASDTDLTAVSPSSAPSIPASESSSSSIISTLQDNEQHAGAEPEGLKQDRSSIALSGSITTGNELSSDHMTAKPAEEPASEAVEPPAKRRKVSSDPKTSAATKQGRLSWIKPKQDEASNKDVASDPAVTSTQHQTENEHITSSSPEARSKKGEADNIDVDNAPKAKRRQNQAQDKHLTNSPPTKRKQDKSENGSATSSPKTKQKMKSKEALINVVKTEEVTAAKQLVARSPQAKKIMKLRTDGRLFLPPKKPLVEGAAKDGRKSGKSKKQCLVKFIYGSDDTSRQEIGHKINQILTGELRTRPKVVPPQPKPTPTKIIISSATPTKKSAHPFFLAGSKNAGIDPRPAAPYSRGTSPKRHISSAPIQNAGSVMFGSSTSKITFPPDAREPLWPPQELLHVGIDLDDYSLLRASGRKHCATEKRKAKESQIRLEPSEDLLKDLASLAADPTLPVQVQEDQHMLPTPGRRVLAKQDLPELLRKQLSSTTSENGGQTSHYLSHSAERLLGSLSSAKSAFDQFKCEQQLWTTKYAPKSAESILQPKGTMTLLRDWLSGTAVHSTGINNALHARKKRKISKRRKLDSELDDFIVASEDDEIIETNNIACPPDMSGYNFKKIAPRHDPSTPLRKFSPETLSQTKAVILSGPHGCGKTAAVYAIAAELSLEVFEINPGARRSGRDILEKVGDMTKNHLVSQASLQSGDEGLSADERAALNVKEVREEIASGKQSTMKSFFQQKSTKKPDKTKASKTKKQNTQPEPPAAKPARSQKQSLILFEEVDVIYEEDKQFWSTVSSLVATSRRPVIMTCNDESLLPTEELTDCTLLRMQPILGDVAVDQLLMIAAHEGHLLERKAVETLYAHTRRDLQASIMQLNLWCQMAINDDKSGLNWMLLPQDYRNSEVDIQDQRVLSKNTYPEFAGMLGLNTSRSTGNIDKSSEMVENAILDWDYYECWNAASGLQDAAESRTLSSMDLSIDSLSALDILGTTNIRSRVHESLNTYVSLSERRRNLGFTNNLPVIRDPADSLVNDQQVTLAGTIHVLACTVTRDSRASNNTTDHQELCQSILQSSKPLEDHCSFVRATLEAGLQPLLENATDTAAIIDTVPYMRSILAYDHRLAQERARLSSLLSEGIPHGKSQRKTRASRAALEGGHKANTRRERWFEVDLDTPLIIETGGETWQDLAWTRYEKALRRLQWTQQAEQVESEDELAS